MMKVIMHIAAWREQLLPLIDRAEAEIGFSAEDETYYDDAVEMFRRDVFDLLEDAGVAVSRTYQQCAGAHTIVQCADPEELAAFHRAVAEALPAAEEEIDRLADELAKAMVRDEEDDER